MLSKMHMLVLGMIKESPTNPYEIIRLFGELNVKQWMPYADSSIYAGINALVKKDYITGVAHKSGRMPEKSIYSVTDRGRQAFEDRLRAYLLDTSGDYVQLTVAMLFVCHLQKDEVLRLLSERLSALEQSKERLINRIALMQADGRIPSMAVMTAKQHLYYLEAASKTSAELLREVEQFSTWTAFLSRELI